MAKTKYGWCWGVVFVVCCGGCENSQDNDNGAGTVDLAESDLMGDAGNVADTDVGDPEDGSDVTADILDVTQGLDGDNTPPDGDSHGLDTLLDAEQVEDIVMVVDGAVGLDTEDESDMGDQTDGCLSDGPTFSEVYDKVFKLSCTFASCHGAAPAKKNGFLDLRPDVAWESIVGKLAANETAASEGLLLVDPCAPTDSFLVLKMELPAVGDPAYGGPMPKVNGGALPEETIQLVKDWISAGAKNN